MMSKSELIQKIADETSLRTRDVKAALEALAAVAYKEMKTSGEFLLPGFAKFIVVKSRPPRSARASTLSPRSRPSSRRSLPARC